MPIIEALNVGNPNIETTMGWKDNPSAPKINIESYNKPSTNGGAIANGIKKGIDMGIEKIMSTPEPEKEKIDTSDQTREEMRATEQQQAQWKREDEIREQTRYDQQHANQYAVQDMIAAGINPAAVYSGGASASGGGISNATPKDYTENENQKQRKMQELLAKLQRELITNENNKDRQLKAITTTMEMLGNIFG